MSIHESDPNKSFKREKDSFFDYEQYLPQDRLQQAQEEQQANLQPAENNVIAQTQPEIPRSRQIFSELTSYKVPKPTYDKNRPEELKRFARLNAIGKGLNVIGDAVALGKGANVNRRQDDKAELGALKDMHQYVDQYNQRMDQHNWREFANRMHLGNLSLSQSNREEDRELARKKFEADQLWKTLGFESEQAWKEHEAKTKGRQLDQTDTRMEETERHNRAMEALRRSYNNFRMGIGIGGNNTKAFVYNSPKGETLQLTPNDQYQVLSHILNNDEIVKKEIDLIAPAYGEPLSTNSINTLIHKYAHQVPEAQKYLDMKYKGQVQQEQPFSMPQNWQAPEYNGPVRQEGQQPAQQQQQTQPQQQYDDPDPLGLGI